MAVMVNGKTLETCIKEIQAFKEPDDWKLRKYPYYKIKSYYERVNSVLGLAHYKVMFSEVGPIAQISSRQEFLTIKCTLQILDDNFQPVIERQGYGSREITFNDSGKEVNIHNLYRIASQLAFKATWDQLNIFGKSYESCEDYEEKIKPNKQTEAKGENPSSSISANTTPTANTAGGPQNNGQPENHTYWMKTSGKMVVDRTDRNTAKPVYTLLGFGKEEKPYKVIFYPNQYKNCEQKMNQLISICETGVTNFNFTASSSGKKDGREQLIFKGFA